MILLSSVFVVFVKFHCSEDLHNRGSMVYVVIELMLYDATIDCLEGYVNARL